MITGTQNSSSLPDIQAYISLRREGKTALEIFNPIIERGVQNLDEIAIKLEATISQRQDMVEEITTRLHSKVENFNSFAPTQNLLDETQKKVTCLQIVGAQLETSLALMKEDVERKEVEKKAMIQSLNHFQGQLKKPQNSMLNNTIIAVTKNGCTILSKNKRD